ncbi:MAG: periplasmic heavy metal sensor [Capsulimonas sp.]|uniref:Spy/CpxP family protein refolding chaperone n=1 Tax=Capsulimonas sp. TaxID=2494211 RepID=UPI003263088F
MDTSRFAKQLKLASRGAAACLAATLICAASVGAAPGEHPGIRLVDNETNGMNLTPAQQQRLTALESASRTQSADLFSQLQQTRRKLSDVYRKYDLDAVAAARLNQDLNRVQGQLLDLRLSDQQQLRKILTPDQFAQLQSSIQRRPRPDGGHGGPGDPSHGHRDWTPH